jgi:hypothetical protein
MSVNSNVTVPRGSSSIAAAKSYHVAVQLPDDGRC